MLTVYCLVAMIITKNLFAAADQCTETQFATPFFPGVSCEDIYSKNPQSHNSPGYYWILNRPSRVFCTMNYTGSSCENMYIAIIQKLGPSQATIVSVDIHSGPIVI